MTTYKVNSLGDGQKYWTQSGQEAGKAKLGAIVELTGQTRIVRDKVMQEIAATSPNYGGNYIELRFLDPYTTPEPPPDPEPPPAPGEIPYTVTVSLDGYQPETITGTLKPNA